MFDIRNYWPNTSTNEQLLVEFSAVPPIGVLKTLLKRYKQGGTIRGIPVMVLDEYVPGVGWVDAWKYRPDARGILEVATHQPGSFKLYAIGKEIIWGGIQNVGDVIGGQIGIEPLNGWWCWGWQMIQFQDFLSSFTNAGGKQFVNVVKLHFLQYWCANGTCSVTNVTGATYWMAPGLGAIQIQYDVSPIPHYANQIVTTVAM